MRRDVTGILAALAALAVTPMVWDFDSPVDAKPELSQSPKDRLKATQEAQQKASRQYHTAYDEAKTEEQRAKAIADFLARVVEHSDQALEVARQHPREPAALDALIFVIQTARSGPSDRSERALELLARDHRRDERMGEVCQQLFFFFHLTTAEELIRTVLDQNPDHTARGLTCHALAHYLTFQARMVRRLRKDPAQAKDYEQTRGKDKVERTLREKDPNTLEKEAEQSLERAISEYGTVKYGQRTLADVAGGELFELRHLSVGKAAPEIEGEDVDGKRFKRSDYGGKVVVLTFSGNWCGPCRAMYPRERELVKRLKDKPFAVLTRLSDFYRSRRR